MTEQDARIEAEQFARLAGIHTTSDWFVDMLVAKLMKYYHQGAVDAFDHAIAQLGPRGETNVVRALQCGERIVP